MIHLRLCDAEGIGQIESQKFNQILEMKFRKTKLAELPSFNFSSFVELTFLLHCSAMYATRYVFNLGGNLLIRGSSKPLNGVRSAQPGIRSSLGVSCNIQRA